MRYRVIIYSVHEDASAEYIFDNYYRRQRWGRGSGLGSTSQATIFYRSILQEVLTRYEIGTVVDAGCGDWEFSQLIDWSLVSYIGIDVVPSLIAQNSVRFGRPNVSFRCSDIRGSLLPDGDLLLCKDVLQHWPIGDIVGFCEKALLKYKYLLLTNAIHMVSRGSGRLNSEICLGGFRTLDLEMPPFNIIATWRRDYTIVRGEVKRILFVQSPPSPPDPMSSS
jgi:SAM-dependent methyltransferase